MHPWFLFSKCLRKKHVTLSRPKEALSEIKSVSQDLIDDKRNIKRTKQMTFNLWSEIIATQIKHWAKSKLKQNQYFSFHFLFASFFYEIRLGFSIYLIIEKVKIEWNNSKEIFPHTTNRVFPAILSKGRHLLGEVPLNNLFAWPISSS